MAQLMPLLLTVSCFSKIQIGITFLVPAHLGSPCQRPLNGCVCMLWWRLVDAGVKMKSASNGGASSQLTCSSSSSAVSSSSSSSSAMSYFAAAAAAGYGAAANHYAAAAFGAAAGVPAAAANTSFITSQQVPSTE